MIGLDSSDNEQGIHVYVNSANNLLLANQTDSNTSNGIVLGEGSKRNQVFLNSTASNGVGISVKATSTDNQIIANVTSDNSHNLEDGNPNCDHNKWLGNQSNKVNSKSCIH